MKTDFDSLKNRFNEINGSERYGTVFDSVLKLLSELHEENEKRTSKPAKTKAGNDEADGT